MGELKHLVNRSNEPTDRVDLIEWKGDRILVQLECTEFTSLCPVTGQPDFGELMIEYVPDRHLAETKSVKLYLWRYRSERAFNEVLVDQIATDLYEQIKPLWLEVVGEFNIRGGILVTATAQRGDVAERPD